jgi:hypothetical protein
MYRKIKVYIDLLNGERLYGETMHWLISRKIKLADSANTIWGIFRTNNLVDFLRYKFIF